MLNGYTPIFSQFGQDIFASDVVRQAIDCIVSEMKKLSPIHERKKGMDIVPVPGNIQTVLDNPNELMTTSEFIEKVLWCLFLNDNSFIIPVFYTWVDRGIEKRHYTGLYPVQPQQVDFIQDVENVLYVKFTFMNNFITTLPYSEVIHIRRNYSVNEYMGGNEFGQPNNAALLKILSINNSLMEGVDNAMKSSFAVNGIVKFKSLLEPGKLDAALAEFEKKLLSNKSGFLPLDLAAEFIPLKKEIKMVDKDTLEFIDSKILRHWNVPLCILTGDYTKVQYEAFYQKTLEPLITVLSQSFGKTLFTPREKSFGNQITFYPRDLVFMSIEQTINIVRLLGDSGTMYENEKRVAFGMKPLPELEGIRLQSLNYVDVEIAQQYQLKETTGSDSGGG
jgi:HK97 family phage portal protein